MTRIVALLRQRIRRDWVQLLLWIVGTGVLAALAYTGVVQSYGSEQERLSLLAAVFANPVILLFRGLPSGTEDGAFIAFLIFPWLAFLAALMSSFLAVRHTRADEESGRAEMVAATPASRTLALSATIVHGLGANLLLALLTSGAFMLTGLDAVGSVVAGLAAAAVGVAFLGIALIASQLMRTSRGANTLSVVVLLTAFLLSGFGNAIGTPSDDLTRLESSWVTWLSPFGWGENTRPFSDDNLGPAALALAFGLLLAGVAAVLQSARDLGEGFVAERRGRASARPTLATPIGLVWRLNAGAILGWTIGGLVTGLLATSLASVVNQLGSGNTAIQEVLDKIAGAGNLAQATIAVFFTMLGVLAGCCAVQIVCRARQEEAHGTAEIVLAEVVGRVRWLADYLLVAFIGVILVVAAAAAGALVGIARQGDDWSLFGDALIIGGGQIAAACVFLVLTAFVFVIAPRWTIPLGWTLVLLGAVFGLFGPLFGFPDWLVHISPIAVTPTVDGSDVDLRGLWWLLLVVAGGAAATLTTMRQRELAPNG